jgi:hypothetical protein
LLDRVNGTEAYSGANGRVNEELIHDFRNPGTALTLITDQRV